MIDWKHGASRCGKKEPQTKSRKQTDCDLQRQHQQPGMHMQTPDCWWRSMAAPLNGQGAAASKGGAHSTTMEPICPLSLSLSGLGARRARGVGRRGRRACSLLFAGWLYKSQSRPSIPSIRHRAAKAGTRQTPTLLHTSLLYLCVCIFCAGRGTRDMFHVPETGHVIPPSSRDQGDGRKRKEFPEPPPNQDDHQCPFQPQMRPSQSGYSAVSPPSGSIHLL